jgi:hypothetical protein
MPECRSAASWLFGMPLEQLEWIWKKSLRQTLCRKCTHDSSCSSLESWFFLSLIMWKCFPPVASRVQDYRTSGKYSRRDSFICYVHSENRTYDHRNRTFKVLFFKLKRGSWRSCFQQQDLSKVRCFYYRHDLEACLIWSRYSDVVKCVAKSRFKRFNGRLSPKVLSP